MWYQISICFFAAKEDRKMRNLRSIIFYSVIVLVLNLFTGDEIMPFGSLSEGIPGPPGPQGEPGPAGPGTFTDETKIIVVDDYPSIQDAIDAAPDDSTIYFPKGNYTVSAPINVTKNLAIIGAGPWSQIYQSADENLFVFSVTGYVTMRDIFLGSAATSPGKSLIKLDTISHSIFDNVWIQGGYYGVHLIGTLFTNFRSLMSSTSHFGDCSDIQYCVYGERGGGKSINATTFFHPNLQGGAYGIYITDNHSEGGIEICGGLVEGQSAKAIYLQGIREFFHIQGVHTETSGSRIELVNCANGKIESCYGNGGIYLYRSYNISVENSYVSGGVYVDDYSHEINISNILTSSLGISASSASTNVENISSTSDVSHCVSGMYTPNKSCRNLVDGLLESWAGNVPLGFSSWPVAGCLSKESSIVKFGNYSAKATVAGGQSKVAITYSLDTKRFCKTFIKNRRSAAYQWTKKGTTDVYYCQTSVGGDPGITLKPWAVYFGGSLATENPGAYGNLLAGQWCYGNDDSLGYNTIYARLSDNSDPDSKASGYVESYYKRNQVTVRAWAYKPATNGFNPRISINYGSVAAHSPVFSIPVEEWTPITATFLLSATYSTCTVQIGCWSGKSAGDTCYFDGIEIVEGTIASPIYDDSRGTMGDFRVGGRMITSTITTFSSGDASPSVSAGNIFRTANAATTTITTFHNGVAGQEIKVIFEDNKTNIDFTGTNLKGNGGTDWAPVPGDHMTCVFDGTYWYCDVSDNT
jgi:hypothetical protein